MVRMRQEGVIKPGVMRCGGWVWRDSLTGEQRASVAYKASVRETSGRLELSYRFTSRPELGLVSYPIALVTTSPHFGGRRWWFICPLEHCGRRVGKLYLPPGGQYYGCRHCYGLTYRSSQESDKRVSALARQIRRGDVDTLEVLRRGDAGNMVLVLKALDKIGLWKRW